MTTTKASETGREPRGQAVTSDINETDRLTIHFLSARRTRNAQPKGFPSDPLLPGYANNFGFRQLLFLRRRRWFCEGRGPLRPHELEAAVTEGHVLSQLTPHGSEHPERAFFAELITYVDRTSVPYQFLLYDFFCRARQTLAGFLPVPAGSIISRPVCRPTALLRVVRRPCIPALVAQNPWPAFPSH